MKASLAAAVAIALVVVACDAREVQPNPGCSAEPPAVDRQACSSPGVTCPMAVGPGSVCFGDGGSTITATCTCSNALAWVCDEDAAIACAQPSCSFGAPCSPGQECFSETRGTSLHCDASGHLAQCDPGQTRFQGCTPCLCQSGAWACASSCPGDASAD